jgi:16S rRNA (guanine(966)-N(2))-methyltransferase RsmD
MRIIGGRARGRRLFVPKSCTARPTADRIKEAFFNIVGTIEGKTFLDLFAGTGSMGLEAISRGAYKATLVEKHPALVDAIARNIDRCGFAVQCEIIALDFVGAIDRLTARAEVFDILFADPPYEKAILSDLMEQLGDGRLITSDGLLAVQHSTRETPREQWRFSLVDQRRYGDTILSFFNKRD